MPFLGGKTGLSIKTKKGNCRNSGVDKWMVSKRVVLANVPLQRKPERGYIWMFPQTEMEPGNVRMFPWNENTEWGARLPKPPFYETALLSPNKRLPDMIWGPIFREMIRAQPPKVRVTGQKSELQTKSQSYSRADPQNPNRIAQKRNLNRFRCFCRKPPLKPSWIHLRHLFDSLTGEPAHMRSLQKSMSEGSSLHLSKVLE